MKISRKTHVIEGVKPDAVPYDELLAADRPTILKGLVRDWPLARTTSAEQAARYLESFYQGRPVVVFVAQPELKGRFGYTSDATKLDFAAGRGSLKEYLAKILAHLEDENVRPSISALRM